MDGSCSAESFALCKNNIVTSFLFSFSFPSLPSSCSDLLRVQEGAEEKAECSGICTRFGNRVFLFPLNPPHPPPSCLFPSSGQDGRCFTTSTLVFQMKGGGRGVREGCWRFTLSILVPSIVSLLPHNMYLFQQPSHDPEGSVGYAAPALYLQHLVVAWLG